jgi:hypothetical protein
VAFWEAFVIGLLLPLGILVPFTIGLILVLLAVERLASRW